MRWDRWGADVDPRATRRHARRRGPTLLPAAAGPTAIFLSSDQQGAGAYRVLREAGLECPDDVALVAYDGTSESEFCWPPLTVSRQPIDAMARIAVATVLDPTGAPDHQLLPTELVLRRSCGCPWPSTPT